MRFFSSNLAEQLLLLGFFFTPFTSLRFTGPIGPGEFLILICGPLAIFSNKRKFNFDNKIKPFYVFLIAFLFFTLIGMFCNAFIFERPSGLPGTPIYDLLAYGFILCTVLITGHLSSSCPSFAMRLFNNLFFLWGLIFCFLYGLSFYTPSIFGLPLRYYNFFSPLVENVHQAASITCVMAFIMFYQASQKSFYVIKVFYLISGGLFIKMALDSGATKALMGVVVGGVISIFFLLTYNPSGKVNKRSNPIYLIIGVFILFLFLLINQKSVEDFAVNFFKENDGGGAREVLYSAAFDHCLDSFLFGYGPGSHAPFGGSFSDAHNTAFTIFLQGGLFGIIIFVWFIFKIINKIKVNFALVGALSAVGMYTLGGDVMRRLPIWIILLGLTYFATDHFSKYKKGV